MKAFYYEPHHLGVDGFPAGYFRLSAFETTQHPEQADCFVLPCDLRHVTNEQLRNLPYCVDNETRHVFFTLSEYPSRLLPYDAIAIRTDFNNFLQLYNPRSQVWCWGVEDLANYTALPYQGFQYDVHAQLWASTPLTDVSIESCTRAGLKVHDVRNPSFYGTLESANDERLPALRRTFLESMTQSRLVLVPRTKVGVNRYRFFEAMSMARVPVLLCDPCLLPCSQHIDYEACSLRVREADAPYLGEYLKGWLASNGDEEIMARGNYGRAMWDRWLRNERWETTWSILVREKLEEQRVQS